VIYDDFTNLRDRYETDGHFGNEEETAQRRKLEEFATASKS